MTDASTGFRFELESEAVEREFTIDKFDRDDVTTVTIDAKDINWVNFWMLCASLLDPVVER